MKLSTNLIVIAFILFYFFLPAIAGENYVIGFVERYYSEENSNGNKIKYGAKVNVFKRSDKSNPLAKECPFMVNNITNKKTPYLKIGSFRGSSLPNPYWYYKYRDKNGKMVAFSKDGEIQKVFSQLKDFDLDIVGLGKLSPIISIYNEDKKWPIIVSDNYTFDVKTIESWASRPKALLINKGSYVKTILPNPNQGNRSEADSIWIHQGTRKGVNRGSEGCLTLHPDDWSDFINLFPEQKEWNDNNYSGRLILNRELKFDNFPFPSSPKNLRIIH